MRFLLLFFLICFNSYTQETEHSLNIGYSASYHPMAATKYTDRLKNKLSNDGKLIRNYRADYSLKLSEGDTYEKTFYFVAKDCLDSFAWGAGKSWGVQSESHEIGFLLGAYMLNYKTWESYGFPPYWLELPLNQGIVPVVGLELNIELFKYKNVGLKFHNLLSPWLTNHALMFSISF